MSESLPNATIELWTDGACAGNPGAGGWGCLLVARDDDGAVLRIRELSGGELESTNNRMELKAVIEGLRALSRRSQVRIHLDSTYVMKAFTEGWLEAWRLRGWKTAAKKPVANRDLWEELDAAVSNHDVSWGQGKGHAGVEYNERADALAVAAREAIVG